MHRSEEAWDPEAIPFDQKQAVLRKFADQGFFESDIARQLEHNRIGLDILSGFRLLWLQMDHTIGFWTHHPLKERRQIGYSLVQEINDACDIGVRHETLEVNSAAYVLILNPDRGNEQNLSSCLPELVRNIMNRLSAFCGESFSCVIGEPVDDFEDLPAAYSRCHRAIRLKLLRGSESILSEAEMRDKKNNGDPRTEALIERIGSCILLEKPQEAAAAYDELMTSLTKGSYSGFQIGLFSLSQELKRLFASNGDTFEKLADIDLPVTELPPEDFDTLSEIRELYVGLFERMTAALTEVRRSSEMAKRYADLTAEIDRYLENSYTDCDLNSDTIADAFRMSASYLRRLYRKEKGIPLSESLMRLRLSKVCEYLEQTELNFNDIALKCGIRNGNYLYSVFHKRCGMTPKEYRRLHARPTAGKEGTQ